MGDYAKLRIGILSEGSSDLSSLSIIVKRLIKKQGIEALIDNSLSKPVNGPISEKVIKLRTALFIRGRLDIGLYFSDADRQGFNKKKSFIRECIGRFDDSWLDRAVIGIPDRNLEAWLLSDQDTAKEILGIYASEPLHHKEVKDPKIRLLRLASERGNDSLTPSLLRIQIASQANLSTICKNSKSFQSFVDDLSMAMTRFK